MNISLPIAQVKDSSGVLSEKSYIDKNFEAIASALNVAALVNLIPNSDMSVCTQMNLVRVGSPVATQSYNSTGFSGQNYAQFACSSSVSGHTGGITPGKLFFVEGAGSSGSALSGASGTVTAGSSIGGATDRLTCAGGTFTNTHVGDKFYLAGGTNTSPKNIYYNIIATDSSAYIEVFSTTQPNIMVHETATYTGVLSQGGGSVDPTVNGVPTAGAITPISIQGYPLQMTSSSSGSFTASLSGPSLNALNSSAAVVYEVTPGDDAGVNTIACDGWWKTSSLKYYRTYDKDWDGTTSVTLPGSLYGCKVIKGSSGTEKLYTRGLCTSSALWSNQGINRTKLRSMQGKTITFGKKWWSPSSNTARLYIYDGVTTPTYSPYFTSGSLTYQEVCATLSTSATTVEIGIEITGNAGDIHYGTQPIAANGNSIGSANYVPWHGYFVPNTFVYFGLYEDATVAFSRPVRLEQESNGGIPNGVGNLNMQLEGYNSNTPSVNTSIVLSDPTIQNESIVMYQMTTTPLGVPVNNASGIVPVGQITEPNSSSFLTDNIVMTVQDNGWKGVDLYCNGFFL